MCLWVTFFVCSLSRALLCVLAWMCFWGVRFVYLIFIPTPCVRHIHRLIFYAFLSKCIMAEMALRFYLRFSHTVVGLQRLLSCSFCLLCFALLAVHWNQAPESTTPNRFVAISFALLIWTFVWICLFLCFSIRLRSTHSKWRPSSQPTQWDASTRNKNYHSFVDKWADL